MYTCLVFDLDGTLLDTLDDLADAVNAALLKNGLPTRSRKEVRAFVGNGMKNLIEQAVGIDGRLKFDAVFMDFKAYYTIHCADKTKPYEGIVPLLEKLKENGCKIAVLSNKADPAVKALSKRYFDCLIDEAMGENERAGIRKKPAPDSLYTVIKKLKKQKEETLYIGDSDVDIQTAYNAGVECISVTWGFRDRVFLEANGGKHFANTPMDILKFLNKE